MNRLITLFAREAALWAAILVAILMCLGCWVTVQQADRRLAEAREERALLIGENGMIRRALDAAEVRVEELDGQIAILEAECRKVHR